MIIKEGSNIHVIDTTVISKPIVAVIVAQEDLIITDDGSNYNLLLGPKNTSDCLFEVDKIYKSKTNYIFEGYFKDTILIVANNDNDIMQQTTTQQSSINTLALYIGIGLLVFSLIRILNL